MSDLVWWSWWILRPAGPSGGSWRCDEGCRGAPNPHRPPATSWHPTSSQRQEIHHWSRQNNPGIEWIVDFMQFVACVCQFRHHGSLCWTYPTWPFPIIMLPREGVPSHVLYIYVYVYIYIYYYILIYIDITCFIFEVWYRKHHQYHYCMKCDISNI